MFIYVIISYRIKTGYKILGGNTMNKSFNKTTTLKITNNELNPFDHMNILDHIDNIQINSALQTINNKTSKLIQISNPEYFVIIHKSTKEINKIQCSYFKNSTPLSDITRNTYKEILQYINILNYNIMEVIG